MLHKYEDYSIWSGKDPSTLPLYYYLELWGLLNYGGIRIRTTNDYYLGETKKIKLVRFDPFTDYVYNVDDGFIMDCDDLHPYTYVPHDIWQYILDEEGYPMEKTPFKLIFAWRKAGIKIIGSLVLLLLIAQDQYSYKELDNQDFFSKLVKLYSSMFNILHEVTPSDDLFSYSEFPAYLSLILTEKKCLEFTDYLKKHPKSNFNILIDEFWEIERKETHYNWVNHIQNNRMMKKLHQLWTNRKLIQSPYPIEGDIRINYVGSYHPLRFPDYLMAQEYRPGRYISLDRPTAYDLENVSYSKIRPLVSQKFYLEKIFSDDWATQKVNQFKEFMLDTFNKEIKLEYMSTRLMLFSRKDYIRKGENSSKYIIVRTMNDYSNVLVGNNSKIASILLNNTWDKFELFNLYLERIEQYSFQTPHDIFKGWMKFEDELMQNILKSVIFLRNTKRLNIDLIFASIFESSYMNLKYSFSNYRRKEHIYTWKFNKKDRKFNLGFSPEMLDKIRKKKEYERKRKLEEERKKEEEKRKKEQLKKEEAKKELLLEIDLPKDEDDFIDCCYYYLHQRDDSDEMKQDIELYRDIEVARAIEEHLGKSIEEMLYPEDE